MALEFPAGVPSVRFSGGLLLFDGRAGGLTIRCVIRGRTLIDGAGLGVAGASTVEQLFAKRWPDISRIARRKYALGDMERGAVVLITKQDLNGRPSREDMNSAPRGDVASDDRPAAIERGDRVLDPPGPLAEGQIALTSSAREGDHRIGES